MSTKSKLRIGPLGKQTDARHFSAPKVVFEDTGRVTNASQTEPYRPPQSFYRNDGHVGIKSRGLLC